jgi:hypothetical protein
LIVANIAKEYSIYYATALTVRTVKTECESIVLWTNTFSILCIFKFKRAWRCDFATIGSIKKRVAALREIGIRT